VEGRLLRQQQFDFARPERASIDASGHTRRPNWPTLSRSPSAITSRRRRPPECDRPFGGHCYNV
jgi:hypothetical protein